MAVLHPRELHGDCPDPASWYACTSGTSFLGCCLSDPCTRDGCPASDLMAAEMGNLPYGGFKDQSCNGVGSFYTCTIPSFVGCCVSNPCQDGGCLQSDLLPAYWADGDYSFLPASALALAAASASASSTTETTSSSTFSDVSTISQSSSISTSASTTTVPSTLTTTTSSTSATTTAESATATASASPSPNVAAIAGGTGGGAVAVFLVFAFIVLFYWRRTRESRHAQQFAMATSASGRAPPEAVTPAAGPDEKGGWPSGSSQQRYDRSPASKLSPAPPSWPSPAQSSSSFQPSPQLPTYTPYRPGALAGAASAAGWTAAPMLPPHGSGFRSQSPSAARGMTGAANEMHYQELEGSAARPNGQ